MKNLSRIFTLLTTHFPHKRNFLWSAVGAVCAYEYLLRPLAAFCLPDAPDLPSVAAEIEHMLALVSGIGGGQ